MLSLDVVQSHVIVLKGRNRLVSYCIQVKRGDESWRVFQTEEQISKLCAALLQPSIEGHLYKKASNSIVPKWNKRYFKFIGSTLYYSHETPGFDIVGTSYKKIEIYDARIMPTNDIDSHLDFNNNMKGLFEIHKKDKKALYLKASTKGEMVKWLEALRAESEEHRRTRSAPVTPLVRSSSPTHHARSPSHPPPYSPSPFSPSSPSSPSLSSSPSSSPRQRLTKKDSSSDFRMLLARSPEPMKSSGELIKSSGEIVESRGRSSKSSLDLRSRSNSLKGSGEFTKDDGGVLKGGSDVIKSSSGVLKSSGELTKSDSGDIGDEVNFKHARINNLLKSLSAAHPDSEVLHSFLLVNAFPNESYPQMRMMLDAVKENNLTLIENLHEQYGVALNFTYKGLSLFVEACRSGSIPIVKFTTEPESSVEELIYTKDTFDSSALHYACISSLPIACMLVSIGRMEKFVQAFGLWTPLHHLAQHTNAVIKEQIDYLDKLISSMLPMINSQDLAGNTPLHICAKQSNLSMSLLLLQKGAKMDKLTMQQKTFLHLLAYNTSPKSHDMMAQILQYIFKNTITLEECDAHFNLLELRDTEGNTAIRCAIEKNYKSAHASCLEQLYTELENFKFSLIFTEILYQCGQKSMANIRSTSAFIALIGFLCSACNLNDYHSDVPHLIRRSLDLISRCENCLLDLNISDKEREEFMEEVKREIYPFIHSLFLKKKLSIDSILNRCLRLYNKNVTYSGFGITEAFWNKVKAKNKLAEGQRRKNSADKPEEEQLLVRRALEILAEVPKLVKPAEKVNCLREIFDMFECLGADEEFSLLSYLMVKGASLNIQWSAEIDYILTFGPLENCMMLKGMQMFFLTSWMQMKNGMFQVEEVTTTESLTIMDIKSLWDEIKQSPAGQHDISLLHGLFFSCAHNTSDTKFVTIEGCFSPTILSNYYMKSIQERLQMTIVTTDHGTTEVAYGEFLDPSLFARLGTAFYGMLEEKG